VGLQWSGHTARCPEPAQPAWWSDQDYNNKAAIATFLYQDENGVPDPAGRQIAEKVSEIVNGVLTQKFVKRGAIFSCDEFSAARFVNLAVFSFLFLSFLDFLGFCGYYKLLNTELIPV
jgi:hypothetical protein